MAAWRQLLVGCAEHRARDAIRRIAADLRPAVERGGPVCGSSLLLGEAGLAVFFAYLARTGIDPDARDVAVSLVARVADAIADGPEQFGLAAGLAGMAWSIEHLRHELFGVAAGDPLEEVDAAVLEVLRADQGASTYLDLLDGLVGLGVYALERVPRPAATEMLRLIVSRLRVVAHHDYRGVHWLKPPRPFEPPLPNGWDGSRAYVDLGMARGQAGIVALLARVAESGLPDFGSRDLLVGAIRYMLACRRPAVEDGWFSVIAVDGLRFGPAQTAWCYGDPGMCTALWRASRVVDVADLRESVAGLGASLADRALCDARIFDAGLCHGASGVGHVLNRLSHRLSDRRLGAAAVRWFEHALAMQRPGHGIGGFLFEWDSTIQPLPGVLRGAAGVGLALIAAVSPMEPDWDRALLV